MFWVKELKMLVWFQKCASKVFRSRSLFHLKFNVWLINKIYITVGIGLAFSHVCLLSKQRDACILPPEKWGFYFQYNFPESFCCLLEQLKATYQIHMTLLRKSKQGVRTTKTSHRILFWPPTHFRKAHGEFYFKNTL